MNPRLLFALALTPLVLQGQTAPANLDFRQGDVGSRPIGWESPRDDRDHVVRISDEGVRPGSRCVVIENRGDRAPAGVGLLKQSFSAAAYRGRNVRLRASVRLVPEGSNVAGECKAQMWLRVDLPAKVGVLGFLDDMNDRPITSSEWKPYQIKGSVDEEAETITIGIMLVGSGRVFVDEVQFETGAARPLFHDVAPRAEDAPKVEWLAKNAVPIRAIDPTDGEFSDLTPLKKIIGDVRIVQLGEQSHGDGATFCAKARLIRFLHAQMGFDVLAWESGFFECEELNTALASDLPATQAAQQAIYGQWSRSGLVAPLFDYIRATLKTDRPLRQTGVDMQYWWAGAGGSREAYPKRLFGFIDRVDPQLASPADRQTLVNLRSVLRDRDIYKPTKEERVTNRAVIQKLATALRHLAVDLKDDRARRFHVKTLENLLALEELRATANYEFRDRQMGENLAWLANEWYPGRKIVVWAASSHIARNLEDPRTPMSTLQLTMGQVLLERLGPAVYTVGFTAYRGAVNNPMMTVLRRLEPPPEDSLETLLHATGRLYAFVDFRALPNDHWLRLPIIARPFGYVPQRSNWTTNFDAMFFTDVMFPNTPGGNVPDGVKTGGGASSR